MNPADFNPETDGPDFDELDWDKKPWHNRYRLNGMQQWYTSYHSGIEDAIPKDKDGEIKLTDFDHSRAVYFQDPEGDGKVALNKDIVQNDWGYNPFKLANPVNPGQVPGSNFRGAAAYGGDVYSYYFPPEEPKEGDIISRHHSTIPEFWEDAVDGLEQIYYNGNWVPLFTKPTIQIGASSKPTQAAPLGSLAILENGTTYISVHAFVSRWIRGPVTHTIEGDFDNLRGERVSLNELRLNWGNKKYYKPRLLEGDARKIDWVEADLNDYTTRKINKVNYAEEWNATELSDIIKDNEVNVCGYVYYSGDIRVVDSLSQTY